MVYTNLSLVQLIQRLVLQSKTDFVKFILIQAAKITNDLHVNLYCYVIIY